MEAELVAATGIRVRGQKPSPHGLGSIQMLSLFFSSSLGVIKTAERNHPAPGGDGSAGLSPGAQRPDPCVNPPQSSEGGGWARPPLLILSQPDSLMAPVLGSTMFRHLGIILSSAPKNFHSIFLMSHALTLPYLIYKNDLSLKSLRGEDMFIETILQFWIEK